MLEWHDMGIEYSDNATDVANEMITTVAEDYCQEHADMTLARLDFSRLGSETTGKVEPSKKKKRTRRVRRAKK